MRRARSDGGAAGDVAEMLEAERKALAGSGGGGISSASVYGRYCGVERPYPVACLAESEATSAAVGLRSYLYGS